MRHDALVELTRGITPPAAGGGSAEAFDEIAKKLREIARNTVEQGRAFKNLCEFYFAKDAIHAARFCKVERFAAWAMRKARRQILQNFPQFGRADFSPNNGKNRV